MSETVVVLGGGVAGLSAAHELVERGFDVEVYEKRERFGGKARSVDVPRSGIDGRKPLPGEHGFRFFPSFYRHIFDTMRRIPYADNEEGVYDNLVETHTWMAARAGESELTLPLELPDTIEEWREVFDRFFGAGFGIPDDETRVFVDRLMTFMTSCDERRLEEYENTDWWEFIRADEMSEAYQRFHATGVTRGLVAMRPEESSTRTVATIYIQLLLGIALPWLDVDKILDGPTNEVWIDPWIDYLKQKGVSFESSAKVESFDVEYGELSGVEIATDQGTQRVEGDYYVAALPVEVMAELVDEDLTDEARSLDEIDELQTAWMNGIQYYLDEDVRINDGHIIFSESPWALTLISQQQFWDEFDLSDYGDGKVDGILSICISNWEEEGIEIKKPAKACTEEEIEREVWAQMTAHLNDDAVEELDWENVKRVFLDPDIEFEGGYVETNAEPLLINTKGSLKYRPEATTDIPNFFLASDYVRTHTDLATMEGANEAARRAVNGIIQEADAEADPCQLWPLEEPGVFEPLKAYDRMRWGLDLPHHNDA